MQPAIRAVLAYILLGICLAPSDARAAPALSDLLGDGAAVPNLSRASLSEAPSSRIEIEDASFISNYSTDGQTISPGGQALTKREKSRPPYVAQWKSEFCPPQWDLRINNPKTPPLPGDDYYLIGFVILENEVPIGKGGDGKVFDARHASFPTLIKASERFTDLPSSRPVAVKVSPGRKGCQVASWISQAESPHVVKLYAWGISDHEHDIDPATKKDEASVVVFERLYATAGYILRKYRDKIDEHLLILAMTSGLKHVKIKLGLIHMDMTLNNLMILEEPKIKSGTIWRIIDWDNSHSTSVKESSSKLGTPGFMAPEVFRDMKYSPELTLVFSVGMVIWNIYFRDDKPTKPIPDLGNIPTLRRRPHTDPIWMWEAMLGLLSQDEVHEYLPTRFQKDGDKAKIGELLTKTLCKQEERISFDDMESEVNRLFNVNG